jgi:hypothetical protein
LATYVDTINNTTTYKHEKDKNDKLIIFTGGINNNMEKFNPEKHWDDFIREKIAVNCKTQELANEFTTYCKSKNINWETENVPNNNWHWFSDETCYWGDKNLFYSSISYCNEERVPVVKFIGLERVEEAKVKESSIKTTKETIEVIYHGKETIVLIKDCKHYYKGVANCYYQDTYNKDVGFGIALERAREKQLV